MRFRHTLDGLTSIYMIMSSDDDQPIVQDLGVGLDFNSNLVVAIDHTDYEDRRYNCSTAVTVRRADAERLARRHKVSLDGLPRFIGECMAEWSDVVNPNFRQVQDCFKEITECLLDEGCRFRVHRTCGRKGSICC